MTTMALPATGFTNQTPQNFVIDAATVFTDFAYDADQGFTGTPLGATSGGVTVSIAQTYRKAEVDGAYVMDVKDLWFMSSAIATATVPLKELTAENLRMSLNGVQAAADPTEAPDGYQKITTKRYLEETDYVPTIGIVGIHSGTKEPIVFVMENCFANSPLELAMADNGEAIETLTLQANASIDQLNANEFPWAIYHPQAAPVGP